MNEIHANLQLKEMDLSTTPRPDEVAALLRTNVVLCEKMLDYSKEILSAYTAKQRCVHKS